MQPLKDKGKSKQIFIKLWKGVCESIAQPPGNHGKDWHAMLGNRSMLFIGDSTTQQMAAVIMSHVFWDHSWANASTFPANVALLVVDWFNLTHHANGCRDLMSLIPHVRVRVMEK